MRTLGRLARAGAVLSMAAVMFSTVSAQGRGGAAGQAPAAPASPAPPPTGKAGAPVDLTGTWVSVITEDWRWRMITPPKGDYASLPITMDAKKAADTWDPAKDEAAGDACKGYGAPGLMRQPTRLRISWQDDTTMTVEADAGNDDEPHQEAA